MSQQKYGQIINCGSTILIVSLLSLCRLRTTQLRYGTVDKMAGIFTKRIWQPYCQLATAELFPNETGKQQKMTTAHLGLMPRICGS